MSFLYGTILAFHIIVCFTLIIVVLLQAGKGGGISGLFGGGGGALDNVFGGQGAGRPMAILTGICAAVFMLTSLSLSYMSRSNISRSVVDKAPSQQQMPIQQGAPAPVTPVPQQQSAPVQPAQQTPSQPAQQTP